MKTVGVTIGVGSEDYRFYAKCAADKAKQHLELDEVVIIGEDALGLVPNGPWQGFKEKALYLKFLVPELVDADRYIYFDCDVNFIRKPTDLWRLHDSDIPWMTRDRIFRQDVRDCETRLGIPHGTYRNAGVVIFSKKDAPCFKVMRDEYFNVPKCYWDQCVFSKHFAHHCGYLPRTWNCMDNWGWASRFKPYAWHQAGNYEIYRGGPTPEWSVDMEIDLVNGWAYPKHGLLHQDGFTDDGNLWCYDETDHVQIYTPEGNPIES